MTSQQNVEPLSVDEIRAVSELLHQQRNHPQNDMAFIDPCGNIPEFNQRDNLYAPSNELKFPEEYKGSAFVHPPFLKQEASYSYSNGNNRNRASQCSEKSSWSQSQSTFMDFQPFLWPPEKNHDVTDFSNFEIKDDAFNFASSTAMKNPWSVHGRFCGHHHEHAHGPNCGTMKFAEEDYRTARSKSFLNLVNQGNIQEAKEIKFVSQDSSTVYQCSHKGCGRKFTFLWALQEHEKRHQQTDKVRNFKCNVCDKAFFTKSCLKSHMKIHTRKPNSYACKYTGCNKTYSTSEGLRLHIRNHHQVDKRWVCPVDACHKKFVRQSDLRLHILRIHAKTRPHPCTYEGCTKSFACFSELRRHQESHLRKERKAALIEKRREQGKRLME